MNVVSYAKTKRDAAGDMGGSVVTIDTRQIAARVRDAGVFAASSALLVQSFGGLLTPASDNATLWIYWTTGFAAGIALHLMVSGRRGV